MVITSYTKACSKVFLPYAPPLPLNHYSVSHTLITSQLEQSEPKVGPADKQPSYIMKKPTSVVQLFEYIRNCVCVWILKLFQN
jgi:hypothetical protein